MAIILDRCKTDTTLSAARERASESGFGVKNVLAPDIPAQGKRVRVVSSRFGTLEVTEDCILTFQEGIVGYEECCRYAVVRQPEGAAFQWLQSLDAPALAFLVIEPHRIRPDYAPMLSDADTCTLELEATTPPLLYSIVTVPPCGPEEATINLLGPLVINGRTQRGKQVIVQEQGFTTNHSIKEELARATRDAAKSLSSREREAPIIASATDSLLPTRHDRANVRGA